MTRRIGDFADRGVHLRGKSGATTPVPTPSIAELRCVGCRAVGVTVITISRDPELDSKTRRWLNEACWCTIPCALDHGFRFPAGEAPKPSRRSARARVN